MISYADTTTMKEISENLSSLTKELEETFDSLFNRLSQVPNGTNEWIGESAEYFFNKASQDKQQYINFLKELKSINEKIESDANLIQYNVNKNNSEESIGIPK